MRENYPLFTEFTVKPLRNFAVGSLVLLPAVNGRAAAAPATSSKSVAGVVCSCLRPAKAQAVFLFDQLLDGADTYGKGDFIYDAAARDIFELDVVGIEQLPNFQANVADIEVGGTSRTRPQGGSVAFTAIGPQIGTLTPADVPGLLDPTTFTIQMGSTIPWGRMAGCSYAWQLIWTTPSGGEAIIDF